MIMLYPIFSERSIYNYPGMMRQVSRYEANCELGPMSGQTLHRDYYPQSLIQVGTKSPIPCTLCTRGTACCVNWPLVFF